MRKVINQLLKDKKGYEYDQDLKTLIDQHRYILHEEFSLFTEINKRKIKYFFKYKKIYLIRLFIYFLLGIFLIFGSGVVLKKFGFTYIKPKKKYEQIIIYIPDTISIEKYQENLCYPNVKFIVFYTSDSTKDFNAWKYNLGQIESGNYNNQYEARRIEKSSNGLLYPSQYWGKYQFGKIAREEINLDKITWEEFKSNPDLQEGALMMLVKKNKEYLKKEIEQFNNQFIDGYHITESGLLAMAHNVGTGAVKSFLYSYGKKIPIDGSGKPATRYLILGGYLLNIE